MAALSGFGIYLLKSETTLTPDAVKARSYFVGLEFQAANERAAKGSIFDQVIDAAIRFTQRPSVRYCLAALCLYIAYGMGIKTLETLGNESFVESFKDYGAAIIALVILALYLAREVALLVAIAGIGYAVFRGVASLPVSVALIIGALIIAAAMRRK